MATIIICSLMIAAIIGTYLWCLHSEDPNCVSFFKKAKNH